MIGRCATIGIISELQVSGNTSTRKINDGPGQIARIHVTVSVGVPLAPCFPRATGTGEIDDRGGQVTRVDVLIQVGVTEIGGQQGRYQQVTSAIVALPLPSRS